MNEVTELKNKLKAALAKVDKSAGDLVKLKLTHKGNVQTYKSAAKKELAKVKKDSKDASAKAFAVTKDKMQIVIDEQASKIEELIEEKRINNADPISFEAARYLKLCQKNGSFSKSNKERKFEPASDKKMISIAIDSGLEMEPADITHEDIVEHFYGG